MSQQAPPTSDPNYNWHGVLLADRNLPPPRCVFATSKLARADTGTNIDGSEYQDSPEVLEVKAEKFIELCMASQKPAILSGAGLSTASGIRDYASNNSGTAQQRENRLTYDFIFSCRPTIAHRVLAEMGRKGILKASPYNWVQQNHDGLELRAGWPEMSNLIHGQWLDTWEIPMADNRVVPMSGNLRSDLFQHLIDLEEKMDFCVSIGTSHSGLNVDRLVKTSGTRFVKKKKGLGMAMITIQKTPYDDLAALRVFSKCDDFLMVVAKKLGLKINLDVDFDSVKRTPISYPPSRRTEKMVTFARNPQFCDLIENAIASGKPFGEPEATAAVAKPSSTSPPPVQQRSRLTGDRVTPQERTPTTSPPTNTLQPGAAAEAKSKPVASSPAAKITVGNYHELVGGDDGNKHKWTMFVAADQPSHDIESVTFHLHPTFRPSSVRVDAPVQVKDASGTHPEWQLQRIGWGTFDVQVDIRFKGGRRTVSCSHHLDFVHEKASALVSVDE